MDLSIIIVNYNSGEHLKRCLASLKDASPQWTYEIVVVDNASKDGDLTGLQKAHPEVHLIKNSKNVGFAKANNQAITQVRGKYILLLNPDTLILKNGLEQLVKFMEDHSEAGAAGPVLLNPDGTRQPSCRRFPTPTNVFFGRNSLLTRWFPRNPLSQSYLLMDLDGQKPVEVDWVMGACMILRHEAFQNVGGFDEIFFLFVEDADLCYRLRQKGWKTYFVPEAQAIHEYGVSMRYRRRLSMKEHNIGMYRFFLKHYQFSLLMKGLLSLGLLLRLSLLAPLTGFQETER